MTIAGMTSRAATSIGQAPLDPTGPFVHVVRFGGVRPSPSRERVVGRLKALLSINPMASVYAVRS
jgi:hypothetical protein